MKKSLFHLAALAALGAMADIGQVSARRSFDAEPGAQKELLANIDSATLNVNRFMDAFGNAVIGDGSVALAANPAAADVIRIMTIPAGTKVSSVITGNSDLDTNGAPTITYSLGFAPVVAADGPAAVANYFGAAGDTALQAANNGKVYSNFAAITFEKDVYLTMTIGAGAATFAAGSINASVHGEARGIK
jgi:hypothetical protein